MARFAIVTFILLLALSLSFAFQNLRAVFFFSRHGDRTYHNYFKETDITCDCPFSISKETLDLFFNNLHKPPYEPSRLFSGIYNNLLFTPIRHSIEFPLRSYDKYQIDPSKNECYEGQLTNEGFKRSFELGRQFSKLFSVPENRSQLYIRTTPFGRTAETCFAFMDGWDLSKSTIPYSVHFKAFNEEIETSDDTFEFDELSIPWGSGKFAEKRYMEIFLSSLEQLKAILPPILDTYDHPLLIKLCEIFKNNKSLTRDQITGEALFAIMGLHERLTFGIYPTEFQRVLGIPNEKLTSVTKAVYDACYKVNSLPLVKTNHNCPRHSSPSTITTTPMDHHIVASYTFKQAYRKLRSLILGENGITHSILFGHDSWISPFLYFFDGINYGEWVPFCANLLIVSWDFDGELYVSFQYNLESHLRLKGIPPTIVKDGINYYSIPWLDELFLYNCTCSYSTP